MTRTPDQISYNMAQIRASGSEIERLLGNALWSLGLRYRKQYRALPGKPDFVLVKHRIAIFCDSSFWHGRNWAVAQQAIKVRREFWIPKIEATISRDREVTKRLRKQGWRVVRFWDSQIKRSPEACAVKVLRLLNKKVNIGKPKMLAVDFFCGAGGMTCGLIQAGFKVVAGVDKEPLCASTYSGNNENSDGTRPKYLCLDLFPTGKEHPNGQQDEVIAQLEEMIAANSAKKRPLPLVFAICAPCQPFTKITRIEMSDKGKFKRGNDANLLLTMIPIIRHFRPDAIICENVEGIFANNPDSVLGRFKDLLEMPELNYSFDAAVIDASKFGVPQRRRRTIGLAFDRNKYAVNPNIPTEDALASKKLRAMDFIGHLPAIAAGEVDPKDPNHRARSLNELNLKRISCAPPGESNRYLFNTPYGDLSLRCHRALRDRTGQVSFSDTYTRMRADDLAPTITTKCISITNGRFGHYDPEQQRGITPREATLLQTFPQNYVFEPSVNLQFTATLIGNAVPPMLAKFFGRFIAESLK